MADYYGWHFIWRPAAVFTAPVTARQYVSSQHHWTFLIGLVAGNQGGIKSWGTHAYASAITRESIDTTTAVYHYVDDLAYRQLNGLGLEVILSLKRNAGLPIYGNGASECSWSWWSCCYIYDLCSIWGSSGVCALQGHVVYMPEYAGVTADDSVAGGNKFETDPSTNLLLASLFVVGRRDSCGTWWFLRLYCKRLSMSRGYLLQLVRITLALAIFGLAPGFNIDSSVSRTRAILPAYRAVPSPLKLVKTDSDDLQAHCWVQPIAYTRLMAHWLKRGLLLVQTVRIGDVLTKIKSWLH